MNERAVDILSLSRCDALAYTQARDIEGDTSVLDSNMHPQIYGNHTDDGSSSTFSLNATTTTTTTTSSTNNNNGSAQDGSTIESNHSSPVWPIPSTSSSSIAVPISTSSATHPLTNADLYSPEPYSVAAMAVSRYADDLYMNCYSNKMNTLLLAQAATTKLIDPGNAYNRTLNETFVGMSTLLLSSLLLRLR